MISKFCNEFGSACSFTNNSSSVKKIRIVRTKQKQLNCSKLIYVEKKNCIEYKIINNMNTDFLVCYWKSVKFNYKPGGQKCHYEELVNLE